MRSELIVSDWLIKRKCKQKYKQNLKKKAGMLFSWPLSWEKRYHAAARVVRKRLWPTAQSSWVYQMVY